MEHETQQRTDETETGEAWSAYQYWTGSRDSERFSRSYLGHYDSRDAFGQELLGQLGADARLQRLPDWLRGYLRYDGEAVLRDFEAAGHFWVWDSSQDQGCYVFDAYELPATG